MGQFSGEENSGEDESDEQNGDTYLKAAKTYEDTGRRGWTALKAGEDQWPQPGFARQVFNQVAILRAKVEGMG